MPKNNNLEPVKLPMDLMFGVKPETNFRNNLDAIKVTLVDAPTMEQLREYLPGFVNATWAVNPMSSNALSIKEKDKLIKDAFFGKTLPTALETIGLTFLIEGISLQEVTHIIRYRKGSFSADCSGDKWWTNKDALVPSSIQNSDMFYERYKQITEMAKQLYCDMIDSKEISIMDARSILPRNLNTFYYMRVNLGDAIHFIKQRIDKQIQPETDNVIAYQMYLEILKQYPVANGLIDIHSPSYFYIKMARTGKATNLYFPDSDSDKFEWNENDFIYECTRDKMNGTNEGAQNHFNEVMSHFESLIKATEVANNAKLERLYKEEEGK